VSVSHSLTFKIQNFFNSSTAARQNGSTFNKIYVYNALPLQWKPFGKKEKTTSTFYVYNALPLQWKPFGKKEKTTSTFSETSKSPKSKMINKNRRLLKKYYLA